VPPAGHEWRALRRHRRSGRGPLRRSRDDRLVGGVCGGVSARTGIDPTVVRIGFVLLGLAGGFGLAAYVVAWLLLPAQGDQSSIATRAATDRTGIAVALAFVPALVLAVVLARVLDLGVLSTVGWPVFVAAAGLVLIWRDADDEERQWLRQTTRPILELGSGQRTTRSLVLRLAGGLALVGLGVAALAFGHTSAAALRPAAGAFCLMAAVVVVFGPWWLRLARELVAERQARVRAEERSVIGAQVHDSVLQTLALIQRSADQPNKVVALARAQERELRRWLFDGQAPGALGEATTLAAGVAAVAEDVEAAYATSVEAVTVGDCPLDDDLRGLLDAAREATVNAAKWSGEAEISLFAEVEPGRVSVFVRDRGRGFDPATVDEDRRGIAESIVARMRRHGGSATVRTAPGEGTEVELVLDRPTERV